MCGTALMTMLLNCDFSAAVQINFKKTKIHHCKDIERTAIL